MKVRCGKCKIILEFDSKDLSTNQSKIRCPKCRTINEIPLSILNQIQESVSVNDKEEVGWIVVHDENTHTQTYPLFIGRNTIGRKSISKPCDIMIETNDRYMSRNHCIIEVLKNSRSQYDYIVYEVDATNGTFINASIKKKLAKQDQIYLKDGNTIQMGHTKVVLKTKKMAINITNAQNTVINTDFNKTIIIE